MRKTQLLRIDNGKNSLKYREFINTYLKIMKSQKTTKHGEFYNDRVVEYAIWQICIRKSL